MSRKEKRPAGKARMPTLNSGYTEGGASLESNVLKGWIPQRLSAKSDIMPRLDILRSRSADQAINSPMGSAAIKTSSMHTIGAGLRLFPRLRYKSLGLTADEAREWTRKTAQEFDLWASSVLCDITKRNNFYDMQDIAYTGYLTDGDAFAMFRHKAGTHDMPYSLRIQLIEANRVSNPDQFGALPYAVDIQAPDSNNRIINGVEIDADGAVTAYWVSNRVPWDTIDSYKEAEWTRVKAFGSRSGRPNILQVCHDTRPEQYRGVPYLAPVIETLKEVSRYTTAELTAAIIRSFFALFFVQQENTKDLNAILGEAIGTNNDQEEELDLNEYALTAGTMNALPKGVDVKAVNATGTASTFDVFVGHLIKQIGAAIGVPYEVLTKHFSSSYSASRAALLQAWEEFKLRRTWFSRDFCQPVYEAWLAEAIALGRVEAPGFFEDPAKRAAWCNAEWYGPTMSILDPVKDVNGSNLRVYNGLSTREKEAAEMTGTDLEENLEQLAYEKRIIQELGLELAKPTSTTDLQPDTGGSNDDEQKGGAS